MKRILVGFAIGSAFLSAPIAAQQVTVQGRVVEAGTRTGISRAEIRVGDARVLSETDGGFRMTRVPRGRALVRVAAFGYRAREFSIDVNGDTALLVELEPQAVPVDSLVIQTGDITVRGRVFALATDEPIGDAAITIRNRSTSSNLAGSFKVTRVPRNTPVTVEVGAVAFLPVTLTITADRDTTLRVGLAPDPVGQAMLDEAVSRIEVRSRAVPFTRDQWSRNQLTQFPRTIEDLLLQRYGRRINPSCIFVNDVEMSLAGAQLLQTYYTDELERVEVFNRGTMVRLYTRRYVAKQGESVRLRPILLVVGMGRPMCQ
jgi:hypothetical protein